MPEWMKTAFSFAGFLSAWAATIYMAKNWFEAKVLTRIDKLENKVSHIDDNMFKFTNNMASHIIKITKSQMDLSSSLNKTAMELSEKVIEASKQGAAGVARVKLLEKTSEQQQEINSKLMKIATITHNKAVNLETEVKQISADMIYVKNKVQK